MTELLEVYKCEVCGNIVEMVHGGQGELVCCDKPMVLQKPRTEDKGQEKHVPVVEKTDHGVKVKIGSVPHPMEEEHHIEWIEVIVGDKAYREFLKAGQEPEATFCVPEGSMTVREYCNIHGLWKTS
ncbi:MAG: desulfoferrodoxin [Desulfatibacillaceae bacterium]